MKKLLGKIALVALLSVSSFGDDTKDAWIADNKQDYKTGFRLFNKACENSDSDGCYMIGLHYEAGRGVQKNYKLALKYYKKSCNMGNSTGCQLITHLRNDIPACTEEELSFLKKKSYFRIGSTEIDLIIVADAQTIRIDRKNKIIQVSTASVVNQKVRDDLIQQLGPSFNNFGYYKNINLINYGNMTNKINASIFYDCDGSSIITISTNKWRKFLPGSGMEGITKTIMKKYKLK